jgi:glycerol kinase
MRGHIFSIVEMNVSLTLIIQVCAYLQLFVTLQECNVRAIIESQFLSMFVHSKAIGMSVTERILATGGASKNRHILQVMSDVFGVPVYTHSQPNSASLGAAYRALHGWLSKDSKEAVSFDDVVANAAPFNKEVDCDGFFKQTSMITILCVLLGLLLS